MDKLKVLENIVTNMYLEERKNKDTWSCAWCSALEFVIFEIDKLQKK